MNSYHDPFIPTKHAIQNRCTLESKLQDRRDTTSLLVHWDTCLPYIWDVEDADGDWQEKEEQWSACEH